MTSITHATTQVTGIASSSGLPSGVSASYASNVITISGTPTQSGTFNYTITPSSSCGTAAATGTITVNAALSAGSIGTAQTICYNATPSGLTSVSAATGGVGAYTYGWQSSSDNTTFTDIASTNATTYSPGALTANTYYRRKVTAATCGGTKFSASILITVNSALSAGSVGTAQTICSNTAPIGLTSTAAPAGGTGSYTYQWQSSSDNST